MRFLGAVCALALMAVPSLARPLGTQHVLDFAPEPDAFTDGLGPLLGELEALDPMDPDTKPLTCIDPSADLPFKADLPLLSFPLDPAVLALTVGTKGRAIGAVSIVIDADAPNVTFATSVSASDPTLLASLQLTPPTLLFNNLTGELSYNLTTPTKFALPADCAIAKVTVTVPATEANRTALELKVRAAMMGIDVSGSAPKAPLDPAGPLDYQSLDLVSVFGAVALSAASVNSTVKVVGVNGAVSADGLVTGGNVSVLASKGGISLTNSYVNANVSLISILAPVLASSVSFNGSFNASSRMGGATAAPLTILRDPAYPTNNSIYVWSVFSGASVTLTDPFTGAVNVSSGFMYRPVVTDARGLLTLTPGIVPSRVSGWRGSLPGLADSAIVACRVGAAELKFVG